MARWEPSAEMVEALAKELHEAYRSTNRGCIVSWVEASPIAHDGVRAEARFILRRQHERECGLLEALENISRYGDAYLPCPTTALLALERHAKLDAPKVPTVAEAFKRVRDLWAKAQTNKLDGPLSDALDAWMAAVEREL